MDVSRRTKYNNKRVKEDGYTFDSKAEHRRYLQLKICVKAGVITKLKVHPRFVLTAGIVYVADFEYMQDGGDGRPRKVVEDVKGVKTGVYLNKKKLFAHDYPDIVFREIQAMEV